MPAYDYQCQDCGTPFTLRRSISAYTAGPRAACPECGSSRTTRRLGAANVLGSRPDTGRSAATGCGSGFT